MVEQDDAAIKHVASGIGHNHVVEFAVRIDQLLQRATELAPVLVSQEEDLFARELDGCYAHQLRITVGKMVDDLELIAKATSWEEWRGRIGCEYLPTG